MLESKFEPLYINIMIYFIYYSDNDTGNPMVAGYQADVDPDDFAPTMANIKVRSTTLNMDK